MANGHKPVSSSSKQSLFDRVGCAISSFVADIAATPLAQIAVILVCAAWFLGGFETDILTAILSILAITLTQMVLNQQKARETEAHRRDVAMHAKLDELLIASREARSEMAGIEDLEEAEIQELKEEAVESIDKAGDVAGDPREREAAKAAVVRAVDDLKQEKKRRPARRPARKTAKN
ncbi:hypothetical protein G7077_07575 [Sphingomonas piscis]|uniref:Low affinity iron permease family protein n=1 Tax=Sphingomonas piscis TaxID=2714943 RepID=A0A6G7YPX0_9SPHN|nr:hypothetical protein [Sphingomonas piscis]QIK78777.1 hypothetical protein G7077_07575 [Sphingomonas piscis]